MTTTLDPAAITGESRMLIDGQLVEAENGRRFSNVNPATEEVLGETADAGHGDMDRAIAAARRAFDTTDWSTDRELRKRCLFQLQEALQRGRASAGRAGSRGGNPGPAHLWSPARRPAGRGAHLAGPVHRRVQLGA
jgi:hypothetical protein